MQLYIVVITLKKTNHLNTRTNCLLHLGCNSIITKRHFSFLLPLFFSFDLQLSITIMFVFYVMRYPSARGSIPSNQHSLLLCCNRFSTSFLSIYLKNRLVSSHFFFVFIFMIFLVPILMCGERVCVCYFFTLLNFLRL